MDFLRSREKDPLSAKYSNFPGWHPSHIYQHSPSTAADLQHPAKYNSSTGETKTWMTSGTGTSWNIHDVNKHNEISTAKFPSQTDYTGNVKREKSYKERDIHEQREGWESTWPINCRGREEKELQDYANCYHHTLSNKTSGFEVGEWRSGIEKVLGCGQWVVRAKTKEQFQPTILTSHNRDKTDLSNSEREQWRNWSTWNSRNMESIFPIVSFRQPPSYTAPPAYSRPKDGDKQAGIPNVTVQERMETFREQTFESRKVNFIDSTETRRNPLANNGHYLQKNNQTQNTESYGGDLTGGQHGLQASNTASVLQYTAIKTKPSSQAQPQYRKSSEITYPDISQTKQTKLAKRKGGETVFCLVSRMGEVSGLSSSPEEPLKSHVLPLLTDPKPDGMTNTPRCNDDSRQNQDEYLKDEAVSQLDGSFMSGEYGCTPLEHTGGDQRSSSIPDFSNVIKPNENKQELQCYVQRNDSQSHCLTQKSYMETNRHEKPYKEILEKFPLWKEPKYQHHLVGMARQRNEQSQGINDNSIVTNTKDINKSTKDQQKSLVVIDATRVVVKVELVLLPEKEHVQYVCLTEDSPLSSTRERTDELKQNRSVIASQETHENSTLDKGEEMIRGIPHEYPRTGWHTYEGISQEHVSSRGSNLVDPIKEFEDSPSAAETVDVWQVLENELMVGQPWSGTTLEKNEGLEKTLGNQTTAKEPEAALEDFRTNAKSTSEVSGVQTEKTTVQMNQATNQENGPTLDDNVVKHRTKKDNENHQKDTSPKDRNKYSSAEENLSDEIDDREELVSDCSKPLPKTRAENAIREIQHGVHKVVLSSIVGFSTLRRSRSSPHLLFTSASNTWDGSHTENEPSSTNTKGTQYSSLPSLYSTAFENSSLSMTRSMPAEVLLCTSSPPEHKQETQHAMSLWDAVSRIRKHTAPDSETEEEEETDLLYQRLNTEQMCCVRCHVGHKNGGEHGGNDVFGTHELEDDTSEKSTKSVV